MRFASGGKNGTSVTTENIVSNSKSSGFSCILLLFCKFFNAYDALGCLGSLMSCVTLTFVRIAVKEKVMDLGISWP